MEDVAGELIRQDVADSQDGVLFYMDIQVVQMHNCEPLQGAYVEIWRTYSLSHLSLTASEHSSYFMMTM